VTVEPWNSSLIWQTKSTRKASFWLSPIGFLCRLGRKSREPPYFPGHMRNRHAETTESSGEWGWRWLRARPRRPGVSCRYA
jgi:hypothetical protein